MPRNPRTILCQPAEVCRGTEEELRWATWIFTSGMFLVDTVLSTGGNAAFRCVAILCSKILRQSIRRVYHTSICLRLGEPKLNQKVLAPKGMWYQIPKGV